MAASVHPYPEPSAPPPYEEEAFDVAFKPNEFDEKQPLHDGDGYDVEAAMQVKPSDVPQYVRNDFLKKVYAIVSVQLAITALVSGVIMFTPEIKEFATTSQPTMWAAFAGSIISVCGLHAVKNSYPANMALLLVFTLFESYIVGIICCMYKTESVIIAAALTTGVTASLSVYALTAKTDFSNWGASLYAGLWCIILGSLLQIFFPYSSMLNGLLSVAGAILFSFFIIYDTDQIANRMSPDDYVVGAIELYLDIINLFIYILRLIGDRE